MTSSSTVHNVTRCFLGAVAAVLLSVGCGGQRAFFARTPDGGGATGGSSGGTEATGAGGAIGSGGRGGAAGSGNAGTGGGGVAGGSDGTAGSGGMAGAGGATGTGGQGGIIDAGADAMCVTQGLDGAAGSTQILDGGVFGCPATINGVLETTDPTQTGRESRINTPSACGATKVFPGNAADPSNLHLYDVYHFSNPGGAAACFNFTLNYDGSCGLQRYLTAYSTYDPTNIGNSYLGDVGSTLTAPQSMSITVPAASTIDVVVFAIDLAPAGVGAYTLSCDTAGGSGGAGGRGGGGGSGGASGSGGGGGSGGAGGVSTDGGTDTSSGGVDGGP